MNVGEGLVFSHIQFIHHDKDRTCLHLVENAPDVKAEDTHHEKQQPTGEPNGKDGCGIARNRMEFKEIGKNIVERHDDRKERHREASTTASFRGRVLSAMIESIASRNSLRKV